MIRSLTGFGRGSSEGEAGSFAVEIRSVNNRFLETNIKLPRSLSSAEPDVQSRVRSRLDRGKVSLFVQEAKQASRRGRLNLDPGAAHELLSALRGVGRELDVEDDLTLSDLTGLLDLMGGEEDEESRQRRVKLLLAAVDSALDELIAMQEEEGANLAGDFRARLDSLAGFVDRVEARSAANREGALERLRERIEKYVPSEQVDEGRLEQEVAWLVDRLDITEELVRLRSHIELFRSALEQAEAVGKRLNFILQEMNREVNTIGSKSNDAEIAKEVVGAKEELEKVREQVQNVA